MRGGRGGGRRRQQCGRAPGSPLEEGGCGAAAVCRVREPEKNAECGGEGQGGGVPGVVNNHRGRAAVDAHRRAS
eukprot:CAMPEP_0172036120 /NCGR_PEP_ID=MMETSP1041-20130122/21983_1 /TAXON_ID=464988 /ORGANISM="Hemiselmis andersenii, Strain CCMP439" /LENGTH=73 /DNA_ID=CAMNT_0012693305 /DNA_START=251 /DNA_END=469 /DNA_ORIENTATION=-